MKRIERWTPAFALALVLALAFGAAGCRKNEQGIGVNAVRTNPDILQGTVTLTGVVGAYAREPGIFGLMDVAELACKDANCNKFYVPVKVEGELPKLGDEVLATGKLVEMPGGKMFAATKVKTIRNHKL